MKRFLFATLLAAGLATSACASGPEIPATDAKALVQKGAVLVDVRTPEEFSAGHIDGALNIPVSDLEARKGELPKDKDIVLYCRSGARSGRGRELLLAAGFKKVHNLGAMTNWK